MKQILYFWSQQTPLEIVHVPLQWPHPASNCSLAFSSLVACNSTAMSSTSGRTKGSSQPMKAKRTQEYMLCGIRTGLIVILCSYIRETFISAIFSAYLSAVIQKWPEIILRKTEGCSQKTEPSPTDRHFMSSQRHYMVSRKKNKQQKRLALCPLVWVENLKQCECNSTQRERVNQGTECHMTCLLSPLSLTWLSL